MRSRVFVAIVFLTLIGSRTSGTPWQQGTGDSSGEFGTIQGVVTVAGSSEPIPDVEISVNGGRRNVFAEMLGPNATVQQTQSLAQSVLDAAEHGTSVPAELLQMAQELMKGGSPDAAKKPAPLSALTDASGRFRIENVPAGSAVLRAHLKGYFAPATHGETVPTVEQEAIVEARKTTDVQLRMVRGGTISGRVYSAAGRAMTDASVQVLRPGYERGRFSPQFVDMKLTDDRGEYRSNRIPPGEYYVLVSPQRIASTGSASSGEIPIATLYPDAIDVATAQPLSLGPGNELSNIDIRVRNAQRAKISGRVVSSLPPGPVTGQRGQARPSTAAIAFMLRDSIGLAELNGGGAIVLNGPPSVTAKPDGSFEITNIPPGIYDLFGRLPLAANTGWGTANPPSRATVPWAVGRVTVDANAGSVEGVNLVIGPGMDLNGRLIVDGRPAGGDIRISLQPDDSASNVNDGQMVQVYGQIAAFEPAINPEGSFTFPLLPEGPYRVHTAFGSAGRQTRDLPIAPLPETAYVADVRQGGVSVYDSGILIGSGAPSPVEIVVNTNGGTIEGTVLGRDEKSASGMIVVLVPAPNQRSNSERYKMVTSDEAGRFTISRIPPGTYTLFASPSVQAGALQNAKVLEKYSRYGTGLNVSSGVPTSIMLKVIPID